MSILLSSTTKGTDYGNVVLSEENRITTFSEKPSENTSACVNAGVYVINRSLLNSLQPDKQYSLEKDCLPSWIHSHRIFGMLTDKEVCDIGTQERYKTYQTILLEESTILSSILVNFSSIKLLEKLARLYTLYGCYDSRCNCCSGKQPVFCDCRFRRAYFGNRH